MSATPMDKANGHRLLDLAFGGGSPLSGSAKNNVGADFMQGFSQAVKKVQEKRKSLGPQGPREGHHAISRPTDQKRIQNPHSENEIQDPRPPVKTKRTGPATSKRSVDRSDSAPENGAVENQWKAKPKSNPKAESTPQAEAAAENRETRPKPKVKEPENTENPEDTRKPATQPDSQAMPDSESLPVTQPDNKDNQSESTSLAKSGEEKSEDGIVTQEEWDDWSAFMALAMLDPEGMAEPEMKFENQGDDDAAQGVDSPDQETEASSPFTSVREKTFTSQQPNPRIHPIESEQQLAGKIESWSGKDPEFQLQENEGEVGIDLPPATWETAKGGKGGVQRVQGETALPAHGVPSETLVMRSQSPLDPTGPNQLNPKSHYNPLPSERIMAGEGIGNPLSPSPISSAPQNVHPEALRVLHSQVEIPEEEPVIVTAESLRGERSLTQKSDAANPSASVSAASNPSQNQSNLADQGGKQPSEFQLENPSVSGFKWSGNRSESPASTFASQLNDSPNQTGSAQSRLQDIQAMLKREMDVRATSLWQTGKEEIQIQLTPEHLGRVRVALEVHNGNVTAHIQVQSEAAKQAVDQGMQQLRENLQLHGFRIEGLSVSVEDRHAGLFNPQGDSADRHFNARGESDMVEEDAIDPNTEAPAAMRRMGYNTLEITA